MTDGGKKMSLGLASLWIVGIILLAVTVIRVMALGPLRVVFENEYTLPMLAEVFAVFLWNALWLSKAESWRLRWGAVLFGIAVFTWCHRSTLALAVSGAYLFALTLLGCWLSRLLLGPLRLPAPERGLLGLALGSSAWIVAVCAVSLTGRGGIMRWRLLALGMMVLVFLGTLIWWCRQGNAGKRMKNALAALGGGADRNALPRPAGLRIDLSISSREALLLAFILTIVLIQAGRMNTELDFDSLHYGLRSPYVLDNGLGIYENLGMVNLVYTYSKGLEVLCLPLAGTPTYGFVIGVSFWGGVGTLVLAARLAGRRGGRSAAFWAAALTAAIPGITNMMVTAKNDGFTLFHQLIIYDFLCCAILEGKNGGAVCDPGPGESGSFGQARESELTGLPYRDVRELAVPWLLMAVAVYLVTMVYKPTALVFSTALGGIGLLFLIVRRRIRLGSPRGILLLALPAGAVAGLWYRTWLFTGVPVTSIFASLCEKIGFQVKYPFSFTHVIGDPSRLTVWEKLGRLGSRLVGMLVLPAGEDMSHVLIAWGTGLVTMLLILWPVAALRKKRDELELFDIVLVPFIALGSAVSVYTLSQVDGNYFILLYALVTISTVSMVARKWENMESKRPLRSLCRLAVLFMTCNLFLTCTTSWAGTPGFTAPKIKHLGYYDHKAKKKEKRSWKGHEELSNLFGPRTRVLAFGHHPQVLNLDCCVQSYYDVTGNGGNIYLVKKLDYFKEFLEYAGIEYFFVESGYLTEDSRALQIIEDMIAEGTLTDVLYEWGNVAARVDLNGRPPEEPEQAVKEFREGYCEFSRDDIEW